MQQPEDQTHRDECSPPSHRLAQHGEDVSARCELLIKRSRQEKHGHAECGPKEGLVSAGLPAQPADGNEEECRNADRERAKKKAPSEERGAGSGAVEPDIRPRTMIYVAERDEVAAEQRGNDNPALRRHPNPGQRIQK